MSDLAHFFANCQQSYPLSKSKKKSLTFFQNIFENLIFDQKMQNWQHYENEIIHQKNIVGFGINVPKLGKYEIFRLGHFFFDQCNNTFFYVSKTVSINQYHYISFLLILNFHFIFLLLKLFIPSFIFPLSAYVLHFIVHFVTFPIIQIYLIKKRSVKLQINV